MIHFPRPLRASFWDIAFYSLMVGLAETYISAFTLALGFGEQTSGMIATFPLLIASVLQLFAGAGVRLLSSHRKWVLVCAAVQGLALLSIAMLGFLKPAYSQELVQVLFGLVTLYWTAALSGSPSWNAWVAASIPDPMRTPFFACRARIGQLCTVLGLLITGFCLHQMNDSARKLEVFGLLFAISGLCRFVSAYFLSCHPEAKSTSKTLGLRMLLHPSGVAWLRERRTCVLILFMLTTHFAVNISGPYFNAFMLNHLGMSYQDYMMLISISFIARVMAGGWFQKFAQNYGSTSLTHLGALLVIPTALLWNVSDSFLYLLLVHIYTGVAWGCHELGITLVLLDKQAPEERARFLTLTNLLNSVAIFVGSSCGYLLLSHQTLETQHYHTLFSLSTGLRLLPLLILPLLGDSRINLRVWVQQLAYGSLRRFRH